MRGAFMLDTIVNLYSRMGLLGFIVTALILILFFSGLYINTLIRRKYLSLSEELAAFCAGETDEFQSEMLVWITEEYKSAIGSGTESINTSSVIDMAFEAYQKPLIIGEDYIKKINGLLITTGLFGTFLGLTSAIGSIGGILAQSNTEALVEEAGIKTLNVLASSFRGMSVAFITSLLGTGFSIFFSVVMTFLGSIQAKKLFITQLEEYLDIKLLSEIKESGAKSGINRNDEIVNLSNILSNSLSTFNQTVKDFSDELNSIHCFSNNLKDNIDQAQKSISFFTQALDRTSETFYQSGISIFECCGELKKLAGEIHTENKRMEGMNGLLSELSQNLSESTQDRHQFLKTLDEIPDRLLNYSEAAVARIEKRG